MEQIETDIDIKQELVEPAGESEEFANDSLILKAEVDDYGPHAPDSLKIITNLCKNLQGLANDSTESLGTVCKQLPMPNKEVSRPNTRGRKASPQKENSVKRKLMGTEIARTESSPLNQETKLGRVYSRKSSRRMAKNIKSSGKPRQRNTRLIHANQLTNAEQTIANDETNESDSEESISLQELVNRKIRPGSGSRMVKSGRRTSSASTDAESIEITTRKARKRNRSPPKQQQQKRRKQNEVGISTNKRERRKNSKTDQVPPNDANQTLINEKRVETNKRRQKMLGRQQARRKRNRDRQEPATYMDQHNSTDQISTLETTGKQALSIKETNVDKGSITDVNFNTRELNESDSDESDGLREFFNAIEPKWPKYKPRRKSQLTEEQKAEKERRSIEKRTCKVCSMVFAFPGGLRNHMRSKHTFEKPYSCEMCGEKFAIQSSYSLHRRRHLGIKPHLCNLCGKTFLRKMDMRIHMRIHIPYKDKVRDVKCSFCPKVYTSKINLRKHTLTKHTDPSEWKHECSICSKKLYSATALTLHVRQHNDDRSFKCVICGRGFFTKQNMNIHVRTHSANTPFNCALCPNGYRSNEALQRHLLKVHGLGEEKPVSRPTYFCPVCNEGFRQRARLEQHVKLHETGEEEYPFECEKCHKRYKARNYFTIHMMDKHGVLIDESYFRAFHPLNQENYATISRTSDIEQRNFNDSDNTEDLDYKPTALSSEPDKPNI